MCHQIGAYHLHISEYACAHHSIHAFASWTARLACDDDVLAPELQIAIETCTLASCLVGLLLCVL